MAQRRYGKQYSRAAAATPREPSPPEQRPLGSEPEPTPTPTPSPAPAQDAKPEAATEPDAAEHFQTGLKAQLDDMRRYATPTR